jgi:hypothetical protein
VIKVSLNVRYQLGDIIGAMRAELEHLSGARRTRCGKFPSSETND